MPQSLTYVLSVIGFEILLWIMLSIKPIAKHKNKVFLLISFLLLTTMLSVAKPYSDMIAYEKFFNSININNLQSISTKDWEPLFKIMLYVIKFFTHDFRVLQIIIAILTLGGPFLFIRKYSKNYLLSIVMFIAIGSFYMNFYIIRQAIALSIFLYAYHFITEKKPIKYCISLTIAFFFHKTIAIMFFLYPLINVSKLKYKRQLFMSIYIIGIIASPLISSLLTKAFFAEYTNAESGEGIKLLIFYIAMYSFYLFIKQKTKHSEKKEIASAALLTIFLQTYAISNHIFSRLANYSRNAFCILIPNTIQELPIKSKIIYTIAIIIGCIGFIIVTNSFSWYNI